MLVLWQMPHFFAIALLHIRDYAAADIPVLPVQRGMLSTKIHMTLYIFGFIFVALLLTLFNYTGYMYLAVITSIGLCWLWLCVKGFIADDDQQWGRKMFRCSLLVIALVCFMIPLDLI